MRNVSTSPLKNAPHQDPTEPGAEPFKVARDVLDAIERESPLHGLVAKVLINKGKLLVVE
jgi:hypothetical protein